jgi:hypothetical protein
MASGEIGQHRFARQVIEGDRGVDQPAVEKDWAGQDARRVIVFLGRRTKAVISAQGRAPPPDASSSRTTRRPGSSIVAKPRWPSSASSVDFPPQEQPEMMTKRCMYSGSTAGERRSHGSTRFSIQNGCDLLVYPIFFIAMLEVEEQPRFVPNQGANHDAISYGADCLRGFFDARRNGVRHGRRIRDGQLHL